jgi:nucleotide-binding universal stress UspA family protein
MKKILLLTDYSDTSRKAIEFALHLYKGMPCSWTVLNCYIELPLSTDQVDEAVEHNAQSRMGAYVEELRQQGRSDSFSFRGIAIGGNLAVAVTGLYEKDPFDVVVVGASGEGNSVRLGSTATEIIRGARYPVLVVPSSASTRAVRKIAVAVDYKNFRSPQVFEPIRQLAGRGSRELVFITVLDEDSSQKEVSMNGKMLLNEFFIGHDPLHHTIKNDSVAEGISTFFASHAIDLLVTVSSRHSLWDILLNRSTSRILAYEAKVPLMVLTEAASDEPDDLPALDWNVIL